MNQAFLDGPYDQVCRRWISSSAIRFTRLRDLQTGQTLTGAPRADKTVFETMVRPGAYRVFAAQ